MDLQLVGQACVHCGERISSILDGQFCEICGCPMHFGCVSTDSAPNEDRGCVFCGATKSHVELTQDLRRQNSNGPIRRSTSQNRFTEMMAFIGSVAMSLNGLINSFKVRPDGRVLDTNPIIGFDIFLPIGLMMSFYFAYRLARSSSK